MKALTKKPYNHSVSQLQLVSGFGDKKRIALAINDKNHVTWTTQATDSSYNQALIPVMGRISFHLIQKRSEVAASMCVTAKWQQQYALNDKAFLDRTS